MTVAEVTRGRDAVAALWHAGRYMEAFQSLDAQLQRFDDPSLHADAAAMRAEMFDAPRAAEHARRAHELAPHESSLALRLAAVLIKLDRRDEARALAEAALASHPDPSPSLQAREVDHQLRGDGLSEVVSALPPRRGQARALALRGQRGPE